MTTGNTDASVTLTFRVREQVSTSMNRVESSLQRVQTTAARTTKVLAQNSLQMVAVGSAMVAGAGAAADLGVKFGLLTEEQGKSTRGFIQGVGSIVAIVGGLASLGNFATNAGISMSQLGVSFAVIARFALPVTVAIGGLTTAIIALNKEFTEGAGASAEFVQNVLHAVGVTRPHAEFLAGGIGERARRGFENLRAGNRGGAAQFITGGGTGGLERGLAQSQQRLTNITITTFAATETELRGAAKAIGRILQEEARIGGFKLF